MSFVNHINLPDENNQIYCRKRNKVVVFNEDHISQYCSNCQMYSGSAQGEGVECYWNDPRKDLKDYYTVVDPQLERDQLIIWDNTEPNEKLVVDK